jgi:hypothetical protein
MEYFVVDGDNVCDVAVVCGCTYNCIFVELEAICPVGWDADGFSCLYGGFNDVCVVAL